MGDNRYCELCNCAEHSDMPKGLKGNYPCPLLGGKNICEVDCIHEVAGGMAAPDTLGKIMGLTGKTAWQVHEICVACPKGGSKLDKPPELISILGKDGKRIESGPEFEKAKKRDVNEWKRMMKRLKDPNYRPAPPK